MSVLQMPAKYLLSLMAALAVVRGQDFGYDGIKGPSHWGEQYNTCIGKFQSPIDINSMTLKNAQLPALRFVDVPLLPNQTTITNNGHTVMVSIEGGDRPTITGGPLNDVYEFAQLHFHWGDNDTAGSEDLIDGHSFAMELHVVFSKQQLRSIRPVIQNSDTLTVLAFFFHLEDKNNTNYEEITDLLASVSQTGATKSFNHLNSLKKLMLSEFNEYYTYHGSLTTPPCSEDVTWIDFKQSIPLSHAQLGVFRTIHDSHGQHVTHNFRPVQPLGDREVYFVTSLDGDKEIFGIGEVHLDDDLDQSNSAYKHDRTTTVQTSVGHFNDKYNDEFDTQAIVEEVPNDIPIGTASINRRKFDLYAASSASSVANYWLALSVSAILTTIHFRII